MYPTQKASDDWSTPGWRRLTGTENMFLDYSKLRWIARRPCAPLLYNTIRIAGDYSTRIAIILSARRVYVIILLLLLCATRMCADERGPRPIALERNAISVCPIFMEKKWTRSKNRLVFYDHLTARTQHSFSTIERFINKSEIRYYVCTPIKQNFGYRFVLWFRNRKRRLVTPPIGFVARTVQISWIIFLVY